MHRKTKRAPASPSPAVLLVDDDPDCRSLIRDALAASGIACCVHEVSSGPEALDFLRRRGRHAAAPRPRLVYLDLEMPGPSGLEVLKEAKSEPNLNDIPMVMVSGVRCEQQMRLASAVGANSYIFKAADPEEFLRSIAKATRYWLGIHCCPADNTHARTARDAHERQTTAAGS